MNEDRRKGRMREDEIFQSGMCVFVYMIISAKLPTFPSK